MEYGILGLAILLLDIWALYNVWTGGASFGSKIIWSALILILPVIGLLLWFFFGPRGSASTV
ncbi:MAG: PLD nuclease N-terminal domain-containing protein [Erythrobacter sp.]